MEVPTCVKARSDRAPLPTALSEPVALDPLWDKGGEILEIFEISEILDQGGANNVKRNG